MTETLSKLKRRKFNREQKSFAERYRQCNRCDVKLDIHKDEEIVCAACGETFCGTCINKHQKICYQYD